MKMKSPLRFLSRLGHSCDHAIVVTFCAFLSLISLPHWSESVYAAPITFEFQATVADGTTVPFSVTVGEVIQGTISFEPVGPGPNYPQISGIRFDVAGHSLQSQAFQINVENDLQRWIDTPGRIADPDNTPDTDFNGVGDNLVVSCQEGSLFCGSILGINDYEFRPLLVLSDEQSLLSSSDLPAEVGIWNAFSLRELGIIFREAGSTETNYLGAYVGDFRQIPEPCSFCSLVLCYCFIMLGAGQACATRSLRTLHSNH